MGKKLFIKTFGCQMNVYDSARMTDALASSGYAPTASVEDADMVVLNTCHIREKAAEKVYSELGRLRQMQEERLRADGSRVLIAVAGCVAQADERSKGRLEQIGLSCSFSRHITGMGRAFYCRRAIAGPCPKAKNFGSAAAAVARLVSPNSRYGR